MTTAADGSPGGAVRRVKGTQDILPSDMPGWHALEQAVRTAMARYGYQEIRPPIFEFTDLFARSVGEETDIVNKQMYTFEDQGAKSLTLRPELTASVLRAYLQNNLGHEAPLTRLYYLGPLFRQERPQKGRYRQFHQFGAEAIGSPHPEQDVEIIALAYEICSLIVPQGLTVRLNTIGSPGARQTYLKTLQNALAPHEAKLGEQDLRRLKTNPLRLLDTKDPDARQLLRDHAPLISDYLSAEDSDHFAAVKAGLQAMGIEFVLDPYLVRGLDYYTRTAFEITSDALGAQDALCGGGRYDGLVSELGGKDTPAVGFAAGMERLLLAAGDDFLKGVETNRTDVYLATLGDEPLQRGQVLARELRGQGLRVIFETLRRSLKAQLREANRTEARFTVILGEEELARGVCLLKNMSTGEQRDIKLGDLSQHLAGIRNN